MLGARQLRFRNEFSPKHAKLKADPGHRERRNILVVLATLADRFVGVVEFAQIRQQCTERDPIFCSAGFRSDLAPLIQHLLQIRSARLIDIQQNAIDIF